MTAAYVITAFATSVILLRAFTLYVAAWIVEGIQEIERSRE